MKIASFFKVLFLLLLISGSLQAQNVIYSENFDDDIGKGNDGGVIDLSGVNWTLNTDNCTIETGDYVKVVETGSDRLEAFDSDGEAIWMSPSINISDYTNVNISGLIAELGSSGTATSKYIKLYYKLDGGAEILIGELLGNHVSPANLVVISANIADGISLQVIAKIKLTVASSNKIYIDDILVTGVSNLPSNDALTLVLEPSKQVVATNISSLINDQNSAQPLMKFKLSEPSSSDDLDTKIASIKFKNVASSNQADLSKQFDSFVIHDGSDFISTGSVDITSNGVTLNFAEDDFTLADDSSQEYELRGYLKPSGIIDGKKVKLEIAAGASGITTYETGSGFDIVNSLAVTSSEHQISVVGTELILITKPPKNILPDQSFEIELKSVDEFGNQDLNSTVELKVSLLVGTGILSSNSGLNRSLSNGRYTFDDLKYDKAESFKLLIEAVGMTPIITDNISSLDINSTVLVASSPIVSQDLNSLAISPENSELVLNFSVKDEGTVDLAPTSISTMKFFNAIGASGFDWKKHLAGAVLLRDGEILAKTTKIEKEYLSFTSLDIVIENGDQTDLELAIYFKKSLLPDHARFQVEIRKDHAWKSFSTGSGLADVFSENILSSIHQIEVEADRFIFVNCPIGVEEKQDFEISIAAIDAFQNIDIDKSSLVSLNSENGTLSKIGVVGNMENGVLKVDQLNFTGDQLLKLTASGDFMSATKEIFIQNENLVLSDDFESQDLNLWENAEDWTASSYLTIAGSSSLKHNLSNAIGSSCITCPLNGINLGSESIFWEFILKNSDWDPSSSNNFTFHLLMDSNDPNLAKTLYSVGVNLSGSDDKLHLWKTYSDDTELLIESDFDWNENENVAVKVEYNSRGEWKLYYNRLGNKNNWLKAGEDTSEVESEVENWYSGLEFNFETASRAGELWFDDIKIQKYNTAPYLRTFEFSSDSISLNFSEDLNFLESSRLDNFSLKRANDQIPIEVIKTGTKGNQLTLFVENQLLTGKYSLILKGMIDIEGAVSKTEEIEFDFYAEAKVHDLIINEILSDESPVVGLPEYEFIEIYNASDYPIKLKGFKLSVGSTAKILDDYEISSHEYLILCSNAAVDFYNEFGNSLGVSSFPSLTNSGTNISLESPAGILMDKLTYSSDWYGDDSKKDGGWSLERIDMTNYCSTLSNWKASQNEIGGTPGAGNSVKGIYQDTQAPALISFNLISNQTLLVEFSEIVNEDSALSVLNYTIEENSISSIIKEFDKIYLLHFANVFEDGVDQKLFMNNLTDECSNSKEIQVDFVWHEVHEHDLIINEILADESPIVGLPEYEFIEIYNTSDYPIKLKDFKLKVGNIEKILDDYEISSHEYLILCSNAVVDFYNEFGNSLGVSSFPSLTNSGTNISLESPAGILMDKLTYSSDWYGDDSKKDGGWSLERIDKTNHSWQADNWRASLDEKGGTPGEINSVEAWNPDITKPKLLRFELNSINAIDLFFSESLDFNQALNFKNYSLSENIGHPISVEVIDDKIFALSLKFSSVFENNIDYQLVLSDQLVDLAGNSIEEFSVEFILADMPHARDLVINEILFNPYPDGADYVELLNISDRKIDIKDLLLANRNEDYQLDAIYKLSEKSQILEAGAYLLLSTDTANIKLNYSYLDENAFMELVKMPSFNDDEGRVVILNRNNDQLDDFAYDEAMHFSQLTSKEGVSLERINPNMETNLNSNWISASQTVDFGTPGMQNSSYDIDEVEVNEVGFKSKIFSPDNDGVDDRLIINFELEKSGYIANIRVYNSMGIEVRRLASNLTLSTKDELFWDGLLANKERASIGIYAFYFELFHPDGDVKTYKKTCVLGGKFK
jgi:hypothetical protein